jgi:HSP20 family protein
MNLLTRWEPTTQLFGPSWTNGLAAAYQLPVDVSESDEAYQVRATLPGFRPDQVEVTVNDGVLSIEAKRSEEKTEEKGRYLRREVYAGNYRRQLTLPGEVKAEDIKADFENGVLTIRVPRAAKPQPVKVAVSAGSETSAPTA